MKLMLPPNCLTKHARSSKASKISHLRGSLTLKLPYANFAKLTVSWIVAQFPPVTKLAKRRKPYCCCHIQPKGQAHHRKSSMHKYRHALMMSIIFHTMKTICRSTRALEFCTHRNDGAMRNVLVECLSHRSLILVAVQVSRLWHLTHPASTTSAKHRKSPANMMIGKALLSGL